MLTDYWQFMKAPVTDMTVLTCKGRLRFTVSREVHCSSVASNESSQTEFPQHLLFCQMRLVKAAPPGFKIVRDDGNLPGKMAL